MRFALSERDLPYAYCSSHRVVGIYPHLCDRMRRPQVGIDYYWNRRIWLDLRFRFRVHDLFGVHCNPPCHSVHICRPCSEVEAYVYVCGDVQRSYDCALFLPLSADIIQQLVWNIKPVSVVGHCAVMNFIECSIIQDI